MLLAQGMTIKNYYNTKSTYERVYSVDSEKYIQFIPFIEWYLVLCISSVTYVYVCILSLGMAFFFSPLLN